MHVGVITYQHGHLKTWQILRRLMSKSFRITLFAFPFIIRPPRPSTRYVDRPPQILGYDVAAFCRKHGIGYVEVGGWADEFSDAFGTPGEPDAPDVILHCTAKIVPASFIRNRTIINCHPGLLPHNRGVDAFKWSIVNKWPIGITLHVIDQEIDRGTILHRMRIPILPEDSLEDAWRRAYDFEGDLLANFEHHLDKRSRKWDVGDEYPCSRRLVPPELDSQIEKLFLANRETLVALSSDFSAQPHPADRA